MIKSASLLKIILLSVFCLLLLSCSHALASGVENLTDVQLIDKLESNLRTLRARDNESRQDLQRVNKQLTLSLSELETVNKQLTELRLVTAQQEISLQSANRSLQSLGDELRREQRRNKQKKLWITILGVGVIYLAVK